MIIICPRIDVLSKITQFRAQNKKAQLLSKELFNVLQYKTKLILDRFPTFHFHGFVLTAEAKPVN